MARQPRTPPPVPPPEKPSGFPEGLPPGAPGWVTAALLDETRRVWQPFYRDALTPEELLDILLRVGRLGEILREGVP